MQAMRQAGPVIGVSCQDGAVCFLCGGGVCVCARDPPTPPGGWHTLEALMRLMQEEMGLAEVRRKAGLGGPSPEIHLEPVYR